MVFVWGVKEQAKATQENMIEKTKSFLKWLDDEKKQIILPAPIITEILAPVTNTADRDAFMDIIYRRFRVAPLDDIAAQKAGEIWSTTPNYKEYYTEGEDGIRNRFKYDILILGIAITQNVTCLYSEDKALRGIGKLHGLNTSEIPSIPTQSSIDFGNNFGLGA